jgi:hypothetical protein
VSKMDDEIVGDPATIPIPLILGSYPTEVQNRATRSLWPIHLSCSRLTDARLWGRLFLRNSSMTSFRQIPYADLFDDLVWKLRNRLSME